MRIKKVSLLIYLISSVANSEFIVPHNLTIGRSDFLIRGLQEGCFSISGTHPRMARPCNPAFLGMKKAEVKSPLETQDYVEQDESIRVQAFLGNNVQYYRDAWAILKDEADTATIERIFDQSRDAEFEGDLEIIYSRDNWNISVSPNRLTYYSHIRNNVLPYISLYASQEHIIRGQMGWQISPAIYLGLQSRAIIRRFILSEFFLTEAVAEETSDALKARNQNLLYVEPGLTWAPENLNLKPQVSLVVTQTGLSDKRHSSLPMDPEAEVGGSIEFPFSSGTVRMGPHLTFTEDFKDVTDQFRLSALYDRGEYQYVGSAKINEFNLGGFMIRDRWSGGVLYHYQFIENLKGYTEHMNTWYFQLGWEN